MTILPDSLKQLQDALSASLLLPNLPTGLQESISNLQRALLKKYASPDSIPEHEITMLAREDAPLSQQAQQRVHEKIEQLLKDIQYAAEDGRDTLLLETDLRTLTNHVPAWEARIREARRKGENAAHERAYLNRLLHNGLLSKAMVRYWQDLPARAYWFKKKAARQIRWFADKQLQRHLEQDGLPAASQWLTEVQKIYGDILDGMECTQSAVSVTIPGDTDHRLTNMPPAQHWFIYIDESGQSFSTAENGSLGYVAAVCMRDGEQLSPLSLHCTEASSSSVLNAFADLLRQPCGIFGLSQSSLYIKSYEGWLQSVRELVKWIWRLLPLPVNGQHSQLSIYIEQRGQYLAGIDTGFGKSMLQAELLREDADRAEKLHILDLDFVNKKDPLCAWADVVSYCWQSSQPDIKKALKKSGLLDTCLIRLDASVLSVCHNILSGQNPDASDWRNLMKASLKPGLLTSHALHILQQRCLKNTSLWEPYVRDMHDYLLSKTYEIPVLEGMAQWLSPMRTDDLATNFFWLSARLAHLNHKGDAASDELADIKARLMRLTPQMGTLDPVAELHVALRMAVSDANAFSFVRAEEHLAPWNPDEGGHLTGTPIWDGKILSSIGQYRAFQRDLAGACRFFRQALACFEKIPPDEARRQSSQTQAYLAIVSMDRPSTDDTEVRHLVETALGQDIPTFAARMANADGTENRYGHYLLTRYLSLRGTTEERAIYKRGQQHWTQYGKGFTAGHPWPLIQYHRWLMTDRDDIDLRKALTQTIGQAMGDTRMLTMEIITWAIILSMGVLQPHMDSVIRRLHKLAAILPDSEPLLMQLLAAETPDEQLARHILPFNYC